METWGILKMALLLSLPYYVSHTFFFLLKGEKVDQRESSKMVISLIQEEAYNIFFSSVFLFLGEEGGGRRYMDG